MVCDHFIGVDNGESFDEYRMIAMKKLIGLTLHILVFALIFIVASLLSFGITRIVPIFHNSAMQLTDVGFAAFMFTMLVTVYLLLTLYERLRYNGQMVRPISMRFSGFDPVTLLWGVVLLIAFNVLKIPFAEYLPAPETNFGDGIYTLLTIVVIAPILEEMIFRGRLYSLLRHDHSPTIAVLVTSMLFGLMHGINVVALTGFVAGLIFSYVNIRRRSIIASILLHMCNNALALALSILSYQGRTFGVIFEDYISQMWMYIVVAIILLIGLVDILRTLRRATHEAAIVDVFKKSDNTPVKPALQTLEQGE